MEFRPEVRLPFLKLTLHPPPKMLRGWHPGSGAISPTRGSPGEHELLLVGIERFLALVLAFGDVLFYHLVQLGADQHDKR